MGLIDRYLSGQATSEETAQLESRMMEDPQLRADFLAYARLDVALPEAMGGNPALAEVQATPLPQRSWKRWVPTAIAAVLMIGAIVTNAMWSKRGTDHPNESLTVAQFGELKDCRWVVSDARISSGDEIKIGQRIELSSGSAEVLFHTGARLTIVGPAIIEPRSENSGFLTLGEVYLVAETPESKGFTIETPVSKFIDIGTAFTATVSPDGLSRLEVSEGEVDVVLDGMEPKRLRRGETIYVEPGEQQILTRIESGDGTPDFRFPTIEPPSRDDYADQASGKATIRVARGELKTSPRQSGSGPASILLDGMGQPKQDAPRQSAFFQTGQKGSFIVDLGQSINLTKINSYSWHQHYLIEEHRERAQQRFTLYGYAGDELPDLSQPPNEAGWTRLARVNSDQFFRVNERLDRPAQQACSITAAQGSLGRYRYLLWKVNRNTFFGEFDVFGAP
tara:strand:- start:169 stop:1518 length:1350 start_codon:yes stop_codon:yes gene_type:complete